MQKACQPSRQDKVFHPSTYLQAKGKTMDAFIVSIFLAVVIIVLIAKSVCIVPQQSAFVVEKMGRYYKTMTAGLNFINPVLDRVAYKHSLKEIPYDVDPQVCITRDNTQVKIDGILYYQVTDPRQASYGTSDFELAIEQLAKTALRSEAGKRDLDKLLEDRETINRMVVAALDEASATWGVKVLRYEIKDIVPPDSVLRAMQLQITAEREKRAKIAESEGEQQKEINLAEGEKQAAIAKSEGAMTAAINTAKGQAEAVKLVAEATAEALRRIGDAANAPGGVAAINLKVAEQYVDAFGKLAKEGNALIVPGNLGDMASLVASALAVVKQGK
jgi:regulator of protease activity HflC (stomatin/prohibitin superfamily)